jgi:hypothetical protein
MKNVNSPELVTYRNLPQDKKDALLKFPAYVSLLAATYHNHGIDKEERKSAIEFAHIKTFSSDPLLKDFFTDAEKSIESTINDLDSKLPKEKKEREAAIRNELERLEKIVSELGSDFSRALHQGMKDYKEHVAHAHHSLLEYFIFPVPIKGLTY